MAKRVRGNTSSHRPGGHGPSRTKKGATSSSSTESPDTPTDAQTAPTADIDGAMEAVAAETAEMTVAQPATVPARTRRSRRGAKVKADSLESRSAAEDVYVREDLRNIALITAILIVGILSAWVLFVAMDVANLY